jgi:hypothetical protein
MKKVNIALQKRLGEYLNRDRSKLLIFTKGQFDAMRRKNLRMPIELYHL